MVAVAAVVADRVTGALYCTTSAAVAPSRLSAATTIRNFSALAKLGPAAGMVKTPCQGNAAYKALFRGGSFCGASALSCQKQEKWMDKDRVEGAAEQAKGKIKEVAGKITGDSKTEAEGKADQLKGKIQNTVGGIKDTLRGN
jgi:uncharacterized protein YjbJ (UPF0337 family)